MWKSPHLPGSTCPTVPWRRFNQQYRDRASQQHQCRSCSNIGDHGRNIVTREPDRPGGTATGIRAVLTCDDRRGKHSRPLCWYPYPYLSYRRHADDADLHLQDYRAGNNLCRQLCNARKVTDRSTNSSVGEYPDIRVLADHIGQTVDLSPGTYWVTGNLTLQSLAVLKCSTCDNAKGPGVTIILTAQNDKDRGDTVASSAKFDLSTRHIQGPLPAWRLFRIPMACHPARSTHRATARSAARRGRHSMGLSTSPTHQ